ncbi:MAG: FAD-dependent 5-carboxymethylaminomethyl-2-thiouridine(34) oxidoreductase MnmC [Gammaproteobacteria bacterium]|nr:FAD-dependent 5-carboxymethylaminomethyl-2-thiouridine(34) oxidoreductase MnmC [Gammaproteobacteria bacterium]
MNPWFQTPPSPELNGTTADLPVVIIGAGLAGCFLAAELAERKIPSIVIDSGHSPATGASGNPAAVVKPYVTRNEGLITPYYQQAYSQLQRYLSQTELASAIDYRPVGALQLVNHHYPPNTLYQSLSATETQRVSGLALNSKSLWFKEAGWLNPASLCQRLLDHSLIRLITNRTINGLTPQEDQWQLSFAQKTHTPLQAHHVVLANGSRLNAFDQTQHLPIIPARGQLSRFRLKHSLHSPLPVITGKHYAIQDADTLLVGASFKRGDVSNKVSDAEHEQNYDGVKQLIPDVGITSQAIAGYTGIRATTPDRLPVVGLLPKIAQYPSLYGDIHHGKKPSTYPAAPYYKGLYVIGGFGSRGVTHAPIAARYLTDLLTTPDVEIPDFLHPARFCIANLKRRRQPFIMTHG